MDGQLSEILFKEGEDVKAGDVLARLDPRTLKMQYDEAMAEKAQDEAMVMKIKNDMAKLRHSGHKRPVSKEAAKKLDELRTELRQFQATVQSDQVTIDTLKNQLSRSVIVAPIDGRTGIRQMDVGNIVHTADANGLVSITQIEPISVVFDLPEKNLLPVRERLNRKEAIPVLAVDNHNKAVLDEGTLELVDSQIDAIHGTVHLKARFPNHKRLLWPGGSVHIKLLVSHLNGALVVPASAVHMENAQSGKKPWVFVYVSADRKLEMRPVKVSMVQDGNAVIEEGVHAGEQVVTDSQGLLAGGNYLIAQGQPPAQ
jgi:multidrug efflux system membrane fusion protein